MSQQRRGGRLSIHRMRQSGSGITLVDIILAAAVLTVISAMGFPSIVGYYEGQKLRQAAIELQGFLVVARSTAQRAGNFCSVTISSQGTASLSNCATTTLNLRTITNAIGLCVGNSTSTPATCNPLNTITYNKLGILVSPSTPETIILLGSRTRANYCLDVGLTLLRLGGGALNASNRGTCSYRNFRNL